jgi:hypothetical protein
VRSGAQTDEKEKNYDMDDKIKTELDNGFVAMSEANALDTVTFLNTPVPVAKHVNNLGKGIYKRKQVNGGRIMVGARLTPEQEAKLQWLVKASTEKTGTPATVSSVIAELIDNTKGA